MEKSDYSKSFTEEEQLAVAEEFYKEQGVNMPPDEIAQQDDIDGDVGADYQIDESEICRSKEDENVSANHEEFTPADCPPLLCRIVNDTKQGDFQSLSLKHLGSPLVTAEGKSRSPTHKEAAVIITDEMKSRIEDEGSGLAVLDGRQHVYSEFHWQYVELPIITAVVGEFSERIGYNVASSRYHKIREDFARQLACSSSSLHREDGMISINYANGTLDVEKGGFKLRGHKKADAFTYVLPFDYDPKAECLMFDQYLERVLPDEESRTLLSEFLGYVFLRDLKLEKILILLGHGHNGKSVLFDIMTALMGAENVSHLGLAPLNFEEKRTPLLGKLLNYGSELTGNVSPDTFKKMASGEPMDFRFLYGDIFTSDNYARLAFNANTLPQNVEFTEAFFRRFIIIPFDQTITQEEKNPELAKTIIANELSGVMNWVLRGLARMSKNKTFSTSEKSEACLAEYRNESDTVALFIEEERYEASLTEKIKQSVVYDDYSQYCRNNGFRPLNRKNFKHRFTTCHGIAHDRDGKIGRYFKCISS